MSEQGTTKDLSMSYDEFFRRVRETGWNPSPGELRQVLKAAEAEMTDRTPSTDQKDLLPCPFCGSAPITGHIERHKHHIFTFADYPGSWHIECAKCEFRIFSHESMEAAEAVWNERYVPCDHDPMSHGSTLECDTRGALICTQCDEFDRSHAWPNPEPAQSSKEINRLIAALTNIAEEGEYAACAMSPREFAKMARDAIQRAKP